MKLSDAKLTHINHFCIGGLYTSLFLLIVNIGTGAYSVIKFYPYSSTDIPRAVVEFVDITPAGAVALGISMGLLFLYLTAAIITDVVIKRRRKYAVLETQPADHDET